MASASFNNGKIASVEKQKTGGDGARRLRQWPATSHPAGPPDSSPRLDAQLSPTSESGTFSFFQKKFFFKVFQLFLSWIPKITTYLIPNARELNEFIKETQGL